MLYLIYIAFRTSDDFNTNGKVEVSDCKEMKPEMEDLCEKYNLKDCYVLLVRVSDENHNMVISGYDSDDSVNRLVQIHILQ